MMSLPTQRPRLRCLMNWDGLRKSCGSQLFRSHCQVVPVRPTGLLFRRHQKIRAAMPAITGTVMTVRNRKIVNNSPTFTGIFDFRINAPNSDI